MNEKKVKIIGSRLKIPANVDIPLYNKLSHYKCVRNVLYVVAFFFWAGFGGG